MLACFLNLTFVRVCFAAHSLICYIHRYSPPLLGLPHESGSDHALD